MFAVKILKMLAAHRGQKWFELKMRDPHTGFDLNAFDNSSEPSEQALPEHVAEESLPPGF